MKATDLLRRQHAEASQLLAKLLRAEVKDRGALRAQLSRTLRAHAATEEELFYPRFEDKEEFEDLIAQSYDEHEELKDALAELESSEIDDESFEELVQGLEDVVEHHVFSEENELFPRVEDFWTNDINQEIGRRMRERFAEILSGEELRV
ncbi:MAG: hemerythrin domain-containing protein [Deltaproteobacteria bacterium]|nr:hemerythrin domain-containing protein [Deltaproteobacteria bacterium]